MDIIKQLNKVMNQVEKIDYTSVYIEIKTSTDKFVIDKQQARRPIGFNTEGGE